MKLILASQSPRRREMLSALGLTFIVESADIDESVHHGETPSDYVRRVARAKAATVAKRHHNGVFALAADTTVSLGGAIFGKPADAAEAHRMLTALSGNEHIVSSAYALATPGGRIIDDLVQTKVVMRQLSADEIDWYVASGEPFDKAGGYAIQGLAAHFISRIEGSVTSVIGLPLAEVVTLLRSFGFPVAVKGHAI
jgi:septum formation protein